MSEVLVLSTLHQYHGEVACFGFQTLRNILLELQPDLLLVEVDGDDLRLRREEKIKREYPEVVYPLLASAKLHVRPLEPSGPTKAALIDRVRAAAQQFEATPEGAAFRAYVQSWLADLISSWTGPADANSSKTDAAVAAKHAQQDRLYPADYARCWEEWNRHFLERIVEAVKELRPRRAVVLVGLEHAYWLRPRLAERGDMIMLDAHETLAGLPLSR